MASIIVWYIILQQQQQQCLFSSSSRCVCLLTCWKDDLRFWRCSSQRSSMEAARRSKRPLQPRQVSTLFRKQRPLQQLKPRALSRPRGSVQKTCIFKSQSWRATTTITELPYHHLWMKKIQNHIQYSRNNFHPEELSQL